MLRSFPYSNAKNPIALGGNVITVDLQVGQDDIVNTRRSKEVEDVEVVELCFTSSTTVPSTNCYEK